MIKEACELDDAIERICCATHANPFAILGLHMSSSGYYQCRYFNPQAKSVAMVDLISGRVINNLKKVDPRGFFMVETRRKNPFRYALKIAMVDRIITLIDPYQFKPVISAQQERLLEQGDYHQLWQVLGANFIEHEGVPGVLFALWAPNAKTVAVVGDFNAWDGRCHPMRLRHKIGCWEIFIPHLTAGERYKFEIKDSKGHVLPLKADPLAKEMELRPANASVLVQETVYPWQDEVWMNKRGNATQKPMSIYQVHLGSWRRDQEQRFLNYEELAHQLVAYVERLGFTHIQLLPISEYPFDGSWGYQPIGMFAPSSRFRSPSRGVVDGFKYFVDYCHQHNIGVLIDWVPAHFPCDEHGLGLLDGTHLYEHKDPRRGFHPDWNTFIYNYGRKEVKQFLIASALHWLERFHVDGIRVDAVASMLHLNYSRQEGEWLPNILGGSENLEAIAFLQQLNETIKNKFPECITIAEESSAWPKVTESPLKQGLGFDFQWNMGWMNDSLRYLRRDPIHRQYHHDDITFGLTYAFDSNYVLALSHDEVVHEKGSLLNKTTGDEWRQFAQLRAYLAFMWFHPGKKLLFMGNEFAQRNEWNFDHALDWELLDNFQHSAMQQLIQSLNAVYVTAPVLYQNDHSQHGFQWIDAENAKQSIFCFIRKSDDDAETLYIVVCNFTPKVHHRFMLGVPRRGYYREIINTDSEIFGGSNQGNMGGVNATEVSCHNQPYSISISVPPLATCVFQWEVDRAFN